MAIKRFFATKDNTITNAFGSALSSVSRATGSNMGAADVLETFSIYGQASASNGLSPELSRTLIEFPVDQISTARSAGTIPAVGNVSFYLRMFNARHAFTLPRNFTLQVLPLSQSWEEGVGLDMDEYVDKTYNNSGSNWMRRGKVGQWDLPGGDYVTASSFSDVNYTAYFSDGYEDLKLDVTNLVEKWITGSSDGGLDNYGFGVHLTASQEAYFSNSAGTPFTSSLLDNINGSTESYYTKKFFSRSSEFFFKRPVLEARWDSTIKDNRGSFYYSSSAAPAADNLNSLYFYNYIRGRLVDPPTVADAGEQIHVSFYSSSAGVPSGSKLLLPAGGGVATNLDVNATGNLSVSGIYTCNVALTSAGTPLEAIHDVWHLNGVEYFTGSFYPESFLSYNNAPTFDRVTNITNLKPKYSRSETARFRVFVRPKNWNSSLYTVAQGTTPNESIVSASYKVIRITDNLEAISYGTGSDMSTHLSYDVSGNYFDIDMSMLQADYSYGIKFTYYNDSIGSWVEQPHMFRFRVEEDTQ